MAQNAYLNRSLRSAGVRVVDRYPFKRRGSRAAAFIDSHIKHKQMHPPEMMSRFCEVADFAKQRRWPGVMTLDSDEILFTNVNRRLRAYRQDVVTPCDECSQMVRWRTGALDHYCNSLLAYWNNHTEETRSWLRTFASPYKLTSFNDMQFLAMFLKSGHYGTVSSHLLAREPSKNRLRWEGGAGANEVSDSPSICDNETIFNRWLPFKAVADSSLLRPHSLCRACRALCSVPGVGVTVPYRTLKTGLPLYVVHYCGKCKVPFIHYTYTKWFAAVVSRGISDGG